MIDAVPLPSEPDEPEDLDGAYSEPIIPPAADELERWAAHHAAAVAVHRAPVTYVGRVRLDDLSSPNPRGLHVACDGDPESVLRDGCGARPGIGCSRPSRGGLRVSVAGFVHPSRLVREAAFVAARS